MLITVITILLLITLHNAQVAVEHGESCGRDLKLAADRVSQSEQEVEMMTIMIIEIGEDDGFP